MSVRRTLAVFVLSVPCQFAFDAADARAQNTTPPIVRSYIDEQRGFSIDDLVALARDHSAILQAARERANAARGEVTQAGARANPTISAEGMIQAGGSDSQVTTNVVMPLELFRRNARRTAAAQTAEIATAEIHESEWDLAANVRMQAGRLLAAVRLLDVMERQARAAADLRDLVTGSAQSGAVPPLERDIADVDAQRLAAAALRQRGEVEAAAATLRGVLGVDRTFRLPRRGPLDVDVGRATAAVSAGVAPESAANLATRPDLQTGTARIAAAAATETRLRLEGRFDIDVTGGYTNTRMSFPQFGITTAGGAIPIAGQFHYVSIGAMIKVPLFNRNTGSVAAAEATTRALTREREAAVLAAGAEADAARARLSAAQAAALTYESGLRALAARNLDVIERTYRLGRATLSDVIAQRQRLLELESDYTTILLDVFDAATALRRALGDQR